MIYSSEFRVASHDCDRFQNVRPAVILRYMQECTNLQLHDFGPSYEELHDAHKAFILSKINMSIYSPLKAYTKIRVETWPLESSGVSFHRNSRIYNGDSLVAELATLWAMVDTDNKKFIRANEVEFGFDCDSEQLGIDPPGRMKLPEDIRLSLAGEYNVAYDNTDMNQHLNNTYYLEMFCDFLPLKENEMVSNVAVDFKKEASFGETLKVYRGEYDGSYYFRTVKSDGTVNSEAIITTDRI